MPFGLTNAPAQFMNMMDNLLGDYLHRLVLIFLDNILVYSANVQENTKHLEKVLQALRKHQLWEILVLAWGCHGRWFGTGQHQH